MFDGHSKTKKKKKYTTSFDQFSEKLSKLNLKKSRKRGGNNFLINSISPSPSQIEDLEGFSNSESEGDDNEIDSQVESSQNDLKTLLEQLKAQNAVLKESQGMFNSNEMKNNKFKFKYNRKKKEERKLNEVEDLEVSDEENKNNDSPKSITMNKGVISFRNDNLSITKAEKKKQKAKVEKKKVMDEQIKREKERSQLASEIEEKEIRAQIEKEIREKIEKESREKMEREIKEKLELEFRLKYEQQEKERKIREEKEKIEKDIREKIQKEKLDKELQERAEREVRERELREKLEKEAREKEELRRELELAKQKEKEDQELREKEEKDRIEREIKEKFEKELKEKLEKEEKERFEKEQKEKEEREKLENEKKERELREQIEKEQREQIEKELKEKMEKELKEKLEREEQERKDKERLEKLEKERIELEEKQRLEELEREKAERERIENEEKEKREKEEKEEKERIEREEREKKEKEEKERIEKEEREKKEREEKERIEKEEREKKEKEEKERIEKEEKEKKEREEKEELSSPPSASKGNKRVNSMEINVIEEAEEQKEESSIQKNNLFPSQMQSGNNSGAFEIEDIDEINEEPPEKSQDDPETHDVVSTFLDISNGNQKKKKEKEEDYVNPKEKEIEKLKAKREQEKERLKIEKEEQKKEQERQASLPAEKKESVRGEEETAPKVISKALLFKETNSVQINKSKYTQISKFEQQEKPFLQSGEQPDSNLLIRRRKAFSEQSYFSNYVLRERNLIEVTKKMTKNYQDILEESLKQYEQEKPFPSIFSVILGHDNNYKEEIAKMLSDAREKISEGTVFGNIETMSNFAYYYSLTNDDVGVLGSLMQNFTLWRKVRIDGNSFYRVFMFKLLEYFIATKNIHEIQKIILGIAKLNDDEILTDAQAVNFKQIIVIFYFIYDELIKGNCTEAYTYLLSAYELEDMSFDTAMIIYCRYSLHFIIEHLYISYTNKGGDKDEVIDSLDPVDYNSILKYGNEPNKIVFSAIPFIFNVNIEIVALDGVLSKPTNQIKCVTAKFTDYSVNDLPVISIGYFLSSYFVIYSKTSQEKLLKFLPEIFSKPNEIHQNMLVKKNEVVCEKCNTEGNLIYHLSNFICVCENCFLYDLKAIIKDRITNFSREKFKNLEYYTRSIMIQDKIYITDYDIINLTGKNLGNFLNETSQSICGQCGKACSSNDIITMKCGCMFCRDCLMANLQAATNGEMLQNKFERNYGEKFGCICKNVFDPDEAFKLLKIDPEPYRVSAQNRMNQYVGIFCIICGMQVLDGVDDMMVNTNRTNDNYFRFKIVKPESVKQNTNGENLSQRTMSQRSGRNSIAPNIPPQNVESGQNSGQYNEISYCPHIMCAGCIEKELQRDSCVNDDNVKGFKVFMCKICEVEHYIEKSEWNKIFKKSCCVTCNII